MPHFNNSGRYYKYIIIYDIIVYLLRQYKVSPFRTLIILVDIVGWGNSERGAILNKWGNSELGVISQNILKIMK